MQFSSLRPKAVGIIGGMGPAATSMLLERIVRLTPAKRDQDHLHIIVNNDPSIPDRTAAVLSEGPSPIPSLVNSARLLEKAGAQFLVMPCVTAHLFLEEIQIRVRVPILDVVAEVARAVAESYPHARRIGVLCTDGSRYGDVFAPLRSRYELLWPTEDEQSRFMDAVYGPCGIKSAGATREAIGTMAEIAQALANAGAQVVVGGCTEASIGLAGVSLPAPVIDAVDVLAQAVVREAVQPDSEAGGCVAETEKVSRHE